MATLIPNRDSRNNANPLSSDSLSEVGQQSKQPVVASTNKAVPTEANRHVSGLADNAVKHILEEVTISEGAPTSSLKASHTVTQPLSATDSAAATTEEVIEEETIEEEIDINQLKESANATLYKFYTDFPIARIKGNELQMLTLFEQLRGFATLCAEDETIDQAINGRHGGITGQGGLLESAAREEQPYGSSLAYMGEDIDLVLSALNKTNIEQDQAKIRQVAAQGRLYPNWLYEKHKNDAVTPSKATLVKEYFDGFVEGLKQRVAIEERARVEKANFEGNVSRLQRSMIQAADQLQGAYQTVERVLQARSELYQSQQVRYSQAIQDFAQSIATNHEMRVAQEARGLKPLSLLQRFVDLATRVEKTICEDQSLFAEDVATENAFLQLIKIHRVDKKANAFLNLLQTHRFPDTAHRVASALPQHPTLHANIVNYAGVSSIMTQCPMQNTIKEYLLAVRDNKAPMFALSDENDHSKVYKYWNGLPRSTETEASTAPFQLDAHTEVTIGSPVEKFNKEGRKIYMREFKFKDTTSNQVTVVPHFEYIGWRDRSVTSEEGLRALYDVWCEAKTAKPDLKPMIHCAAGIGRSAVLAGYIAARHKLDEYARAHSTVSEAMIDTFINEMFVSFRLQRDGAFQMPEQLEFVRTMMKKDARQMRLLAS